MANSSSLMTLGTLAYYDEKLKAWVDKKTLKGVDPDTLLTSTDNLVQDMTNPDTETVLSTSGLQDELALYASKQALGAYAPNQHNSSTDTYGKGTSALYGHTKLSDTFTTPVEGGQILEDGTSYAKADDGVGASQYAVYDAYNTLNEAKAPKDHSSTTTTYGAATTSKYGHTKIVDNLDAETYVDGEVLSAHQGYALAQAIGTTKVDLTDYVNKSQISLGTDEEIDSAVLPTEVKVGEIILGKADKTELNEFRWIQKGNNNTGSADCNDFYDRTKATYYYAFNPINCIATYGWMYFETIPFRDFGYGIQYCRGMQQTVIAYRILSNNVWSDWVEFATVDGNVQTTSRINISTDAELLAWLRNHPYKQALLYLQYKSAAIGLNEGEFEFFGSRDAGIAKGIFRETYSKDIAYYIEFDLSNTSSLLLRTKTELATMDKVDSIPLIYNQNTDILAYALTCPQAKRTLVRIHSANATNNPFGITSDTDFIYEISKVDSADAWIYVKAKDVRTNREFLNTKNDVKWLGWVELATINKPSSKQGMVQSCSAKYNSNGSINVFFPLANADKCTISDGGITFDNGKSWTFNNDTRMVESIVERSSFGLSIKFTGDIAYVLTNNEGKPPVILIKYSIS